MIFPVHSLSPTGPTYAETLPPKTWLALRAYAPTGQVSLASLEALVSGAAAKGGWVPIVLSKVCSQTADPNNYSTCTASSGWIDLADLNTFLSWVKNAGQPGGAGRDHLRHDGGDRRLGRHHCACDHDFL